MVEGDGEDVVWLKFLRRSGA